MLKQYRNIIIWLTVSCSTTAYAATDCNQVTQIPVSECQALLDIYRSTNMGSYYDYYRWNADNNLCKWEGVTCVNGHVSMLGLVNHLGDMNNDTRLLQGQFPDINLPELKELDLSNNNFTSIPNFTKLPNLTTLNLSYSNRNSTSIIPNFSNLPHLTTLNLSLNRLTNVPDFSKLYNLTALDLSQNQLTSISDFQLPNLTKLNLFANKLTSIPDFQLPKLAELNLSYNPLGGSFPDFSNLPNLTKLTFNSFYGNSSTTVPDTVPTFTIPNFSKLPKLTELEITGSTLTNLPNFNNLPSLTSLKLHSNPLLSGNIPDFDLPNLISLELCSTFRTNYLDLPPLYIWNGEGNAPMRLAGNIPNFSKLPKLQKFYLCNTQVSGSVPNFSNLPELQELYLSGNQLSGNIPDFSNVPKLTGLYLKGGKLSGNIPNFSNLPNLGILNLAFNTLSGNIPNFDLSKLPKLTEVYVESNQLTGNIPPYSPALKFNRNCGLTATFPQQEATLTQIDWQWKTQNSNCANIAPTCPLVSVSPNLDIHLPHLNYNNMTLSANLRYVPRDGKLLFEVADYAVNSDSCASANLSPDFKLHIPTATFENIKLWADLQLYPTNDGKILFELVKYGNA